MELHLTGKVAVVTGASKGIGLAITRSLAEEEVAVVAGSLHGSDELDLLADRFPVYAVKVDLAEPGGPAYLIEEAVGRHQGLDVVVNNVGAVRPRLDGFLAVTDEEWTATLTINFLAGSAAADSPTGRFTTPQEVADLVLLLAGDRAGNVIGSDFVIDGGLISTV